MDVLKGTDINLLLESAFNVLKEIFRPNMSLEEVAEKYSPIIDEIISESQKDGVTFSAGKFKINYLDEKNFTVGFELYFQDANKKWSKLERNSPAMDAAIWLAPDAWDEIKNVKEKLFDVESPENED